MDKNALGINKEIQPCPGGPGGRSISPGTKRLRVRSPGGVCTGGKPSVFLSHISVSLPQPLRALRLSLKSVDTLSGGLKRRRTFILHY